MINFKIKSNKSNLLFVTFIIKLFFIVVKKICIRTFCCQYIKNSSLSILQYSFLSMYLMINKIKENVNNALYTFMYQLLTILNFNSYEKKKELQSIHIIKKHNKLYYSKNQNYNSNSLKIKAKSITYLENKIALYQVQKRTMLSRVVTSKNNVLTITHTEARHIAHATKQFYDMLQPPAITNELAKSTLNENVALKETSVAAFNYISDKSYSNATAKANIAAAFWAKQKFSLDGLHGSINSKIILPSTKIQLKSFVEISEANTILERNPYVSEIVVTGDLVKVCSNSMPFPDFIAKYNHNLFGKSERYLDCKTGAIEPNGGFFRGTVHQVYTTNNETIWYPHKKNCFPEYIENFYKSLIDKLNNEFFLDELRTKMLAKEYQIFYTESVKLKSFVMPQIFNINDIDALQKSLYLIQSLPTFPKAFTIIHIHGLKTLSLQDYQDPFIQGLMEKVQPSIFSNQRTVQKFMGYALGVYKKKVDSKIVEKLKPLKSKYEWLATELDNIELEFFIT